MTIEERIKRLESEFIFDTAPAEHAEMPQPAYHEVSADGFNKLAAELSEERRRRKEAFGVDESRFTKGAAELLQERRWREQAETRMVQLMYENANLKFNLSKLMTDSATTPEIADLFPEFKE